ncbi:hypothetical protein [Nocardia aobensis]|uniref:hypothetical protein n=1 Tax=Nocardia aobensis TaxID=257277 RepID=UPI0002D62564|nr:hypothetical protein [Nocardia aobensis]
MTELRAFRRACYDAARRTGGTVVEFRVADGVTPNFHQGIIAYGDQQVAVVAVRHSTMLAVAEPRTIDCADGVTESGPMVFVDAPELVGALATSPGFTVLTAADLNGPFVATAWPDIERSDIEYWKPHTLGEALFNYWDRSDRPLGSRPQPLILS